MQYLLTVETSEDVPIPILVIPILVLEAFEAAFLATINWNQARPVEFLASFPNLHYME